MTAALALLLLAGAPAGGPTLPNLDFKAPGLAHWQGQGFSRAAAGEATSADAGGAGRTAILHRTFRVPAGVGVIRFRAAAVRPRGLEPEGALDVVLEAARREIIPKTVRQGDRILGVPRLLGAADGKAREYAWDVGRLAGRVVRIALVDDDARPGCHVVCSGFELLGRDEANAQEFAEAVRRLQARHKLRRMERYSSAHFLAYSNANEGDTEYRLYNCETIHAVFFKHFRRRGFDAAEPAEKMMVALFDSQAGFEAYLGQSLGAAVTGVYHPPTNRLVVYDYGTNSAFLAGKKRIEQEARRGANDRDRERRIVTFGRFVRERRNDTNVSTIMHEVAHQLSFNGGLLNRTGDVPVWLAEGLAVYCESTSGGAWQGIGEANPPRAGVLAGPAGGRGAFLGLRELVASDDWLRKAKRVEPVVLGYSQSWALFRMLMEEQPARLKAYMKAVYPRRTPEHRLADFAAAFGTDLPKLERRYRAYMRSLVKREARPR
jgi:hypothetical protein